MRLPPPQSITFAPGLPLPYPALVNAGVRVRRGQTSLTVAAPGSGKSQLWANIAHRMQVPTLYWSADTDMADALARTVALWSGIEVNEIEEALSDPDSNQWVLDLLGDRASHIEWVFESTVTPDGLGQRIDAFCELHGEYPHLVVIDNLSNAILDPTNEYAEVKEAMAGFQKLARQSNAHIAVLHHAKGTYEDGTRAIPLGGASQNPYKTVELGLSLFRPEMNAGAMGVCVVKNRGGPADPTGNSPVYLPIDFSRGTVNGYYTRSL